MSIANHIGHGMIDRIKCASINCDILYHVTEDVAEDGPIENKTINASLPDDWDNDDYTIFRNKLSFQINEDSAEYRISGIIWYLDGTWSIYDTYDDVWEHYSCPRIPKFLRKELS